MQCSLYIYYEKSQEKSQEKHQSIELMEGMSSILICENRFTKSSSINLSKSKVGDFNEIVLSEPTARDGEDATTEGNVFCFCVIYQYKFAAI